MTPQVITTFAGTDFVFPGSTLPALNSPLGSVTAVAVDAANNTYVADQDNHLVMKITPGGTLTVVAGNGIKGFSGDGGLATNASLNRPAGVAVDAAGTLYISDFENNRIRRVSGAGLISTIAGTGAANFGGDGGPATSAFLRGPTGIAVDSGGAVYFADTGNNRIRRVVSGAISTVAGNGSPGSAGDNGPATSAFLSEPMGVAVDSTGRVYVADFTNNRIRRIDNGMITAFAGTNTGGFAGDNGPAVDAALSKPVGVGVDRSGNVYIADSGNNRIRMVSGGVIRTIAGTGGMGFGGDKGPAASALLSNPTGVAVDSNSNVLIADQNNNRVRKITGSAIDTFAGNGQFRSSGDGGPPLSATFNQPLGIAVDGSGNVYVTDDLNSRVRKISTAGVVSTIAGNGATGFSGDQVPAVSTSLNFPKNVAVDSAGNVYIADTFNHRVRKISGGTITTVAGNGTPNFSGDNGNAASASLNQPRGVAVDTAGNLYIADTGNNRIRKVTGTTITTVAGNGNPAFGGDNGSSTLASLNAPLGVAVDAAGTSLFIADFRNNRVRKVTGGIITTVAGGGLVLGEFGPATGVSLRPNAVAVDSAGNLFIADDLNSRVRKVTGTIITTVAGVGQNGFFAGYSGDGGLATAAMLNKPTGVAVDLSGNVFIADSNNKRIREVLANAATFQAAPTTLTFAATSGGVIPGAQVVRLSSAVAGLNYSVTTNAPWLTASPGGGGIPAAIQVIADPTLLAAGTYNGSVSISAPNAFPNSLVVNVSFVVSGPVPGRLGLNSQSLSFSFTQGTVPASLQLSVSNLGAGTLRFAVVAGTTTGGSWLQASPSGGTVTPANPASVNVTATPGTLAVGTYNGTITASSADTGEQIRVPVFMSINAPPQKILLSQTGLTFTAVAQGGAPLPQSFGILNIGQGALNWTATATTLSGSGWLSIDSTAGTVTTPFTGVSTVNVSVDPSRLAPNDYYGRIRVRSTGASNSPQDVAVVLRVLAAGTPLGPELRPIGLIFAGISGATPGSQDILIGNPTGQSIDYQSGAIPTINAAFSSLPLNAVVAPNQPVAVRVYPDLTKVAPGNFQRGTITFQFGDGSARTVSILTVVAPAGTSASNIPSNDADGSSKGEGRTVTGCTPKQLFPAVAILGTSGTTNLGYPIQISAKVTDDCSAPLTSSTGGTVKASFSNGDVPIYLNHLQDGNWSATWTPKFPATNGVNVTVTAELPALNLKATNNPPVSIGLQGPTSQPPPAPAGKPVSAVTLQEGAFSPGELILVQGTALANSAASGGSAQVDLAGASLLVGGSPAALIYASEDRLVGVVPTEVVANTNPMVIVQRDGKVAPGDLITMAAAHPVILTKDGTGLGQALVYKAVNGVATTLADAVNPVRTGDTILIYCSGLGLTDANGNAGLPTVSIGGQTAQVTSAGVARASAYPPGGAPTLLGGIVSAGLGGLHQILAVVPNGIGNGPVGILVSSAGQTSQAGVTFFAGTGAVTGPVITGVNMVGASGSVIAQNGWIEIKGANLAPASFAGGKTWDDAPEFASGRLPAQLNGVSASVNGKAAFIYYISTVQVNVLTPLDNTTGPVSVVLTNNGVSSAPFTATLRAVVPSLPLLFPAKYVAATGGGFYIGPASFSSPGFPYRPARPGEIIAVYAFGFGLPATTLTNGSSSQSGELPRPWPVCQIGGANADLQFAGLTPGAVGLYQLNLQVPSTAADGDNLMVCTYAGQSTPAGALLTVQR